MRTIDTTVRGNALIAQDTYSLCLQAEGLTQGVLPGQFMHVLIPDRPDLLLRRPLSIHAYDEAQQTLILIYQAKGKGTEALAQVQVGSTLSVLGPLGSGFPLLPPGSRCLLIGGGIGCAPLYSAIQAMPEVHFEAALGFRNAHCVYAQQAFETGCDRVIFTTDDGSFGRQGFAQQALDELLERPCDAIFACGPTPMLRALKTRMAGESIPVYASLEERMGCGVGACMTCTCGVTKEDGLHNLRVCKDGPVFLLKEVAL